jgi:membrane-bound inhibitor of C-type lysozyme
MLKRLAGVIAAFAIMVTAVSAAVAQSPPPLKPKVTAFYMCNGLHFKAIYDNKIDRVSFVWGAKDYHLPRVVSADGARYANDKLEWWSKGSNATLYTVPEHTVLTNCTPGHRF